MKKSATAGTHFNARVVECRLAAKVLLINAVLQIRKKRRLSSLAHTTFSRQGITSGTFFYVRGRRNEGVALWEKLYLQFLRNWFKIRHSWSLDWILFLKLNSPLLL